MSADDVAAAAPWPELLPWQQDAARGALAARATWPHALLLAGPRGMGKRTLALNLARGLLCESPRADGLACGTCASCGFVAAGQHPDLQLLELFETDDGETRAVTEIKVDRIRALIDWAQLTGHRGRAKVAVIAPAEAMNPNAANALLKTLEEPPPATFLILVAHQAGRVPATLRSRCRRFPAPQPDHCHGRRVARGSRASRTPTSRWRRPAAHRFPRARSPTRRGSRSARCGCRRSRSRSRCRRWRWRRGSKRAHARIAASGSRWRSTGWGPGRRTSRVWPRGPRRRAIPTMRRRWRRSRRRWRPCGSFAIIGLLLRQRALVAHPLQPRLVAETMLIGYRDLFR